jgi:O-antigen/teichoic acid export membrane protein
VVVANDAAMPFDAPDELLLRLYDAQHEISSPDTSDRRIRKMPQETADPFRVRGGVIVGDGGDIGLYSLEARVQRGHLSAAIDEPLGHAQRGRGAHHDVSSLPIVATHDHDDLVGPSCLTGECLKAAGKVQRPPEARNDDGAGGFAIYTQAAQPNASGLRSPHAAPIALIPTINRRKVFSTGTSLLVAQVASALGGILTARALGPEGKGVVAGVIAWPQLSAWLLLLGVGTATSLRVAETPDAGLDDALGNSLVYCVVVGCIGTVAGMTFLPTALAHLGPDAPAATRLAILAIPISMLAEVVAGINLALGRVRQYNAARIVGGLSFLIMSVALVVGRAATPQTVVGITLLAGLLPLGVVAYGLPWRRMQLALHRLRRDLAYGLRVFLTSLLGLVNLRLDILVMTAFLGASEIGWYSIAVNAMLPITVVTTATVSLIMPAVGRVRGAREADSQSDVALIRRTALRYSSLTVAVAAALAAAVPWALPVAFGRSFEPAVHLAWILLPGFVAQGYAYIVDAGLVGMRKPWVGNASQGLGVLVTLSMLPIMLPRYGATGAAIVSTVSYTTSAAVSVWALGRVGRSTPTSLDDETTPSAFQN